MRSRPPARPDLSPPAGPRPAGPSRPPLARRALLGPERAVELAAFFKVVANPTRLRMLHALVRAGEMRVTDLAAALGTTAQAVSNQLQRLADRGIVTSRRDGNNVRYRVAQSCTPCLLEQGMCLFEESSRTRAGRP